jgi:hypothetical protein
VLSCSSSVLSPPVLLLRRWSGTTAHSTGPANRWTVRSTTERANPGHNRWGDSRRNARVRSDKTLAVNIANGEAVEVVGPPTGYGRYRWVVRTDLSTIDPYRVAGFFVYGNSGEQDVEFARWGDPSFATGGSWVTWRKQTRLGFGFFAVSPTPPTRSRSTGESAQQLCHARCVGRHAADDNISVRRAGASRSPAHFVLGLPRRREERQPLHRGKRPLCLLWPAASQTVSSPR